MKKKAFFYNLKLVGHSKSIVVDSKKFFNDIITNHGVYKTTPSKNYYSIPLTTDDRPITLDVLDFKSNYLFARIGKIKGNSDMQFRDKKTLDVEEVLKKSELKTKGVEIFTYFLLEYSSNIVLFVYGKSAPHIRALEGLSYKSSLVEYLEILPLSNNKTIDTLSKKGSMVCSIRYDVVAPSNKVLGGAGLHPDSIIDINESGKIKLELKIKPEPRSALLKNGRSISNMLNGLIKNKNIENVVVLGKEPNSVQREYKLIDDLIFYNVNLSDYHTEGGIKVPYTPSEYTEIIEDKLYKVFRDKKKYVYDIAGISKSQKG